MIKSLTIKNYQSHEDNTLEFHKGVNVITGTSRSGKTAVLRALRGNRYNDPMGFAFNSYWNRDNKKQPKEIFGSVVKFFEGTEVARERKKGFNGYKTHDDQTYEVLKDFPEQINQIWNMSEVNFQKQFSQPFLLSESAPEIARFFNRIIGLDKIDTVLSKAEDKRRKTNQSIKEIDSQIESYKTELEGYSWVDRTSDLIESAIIREKEIEENKSLQGELVSVVDEINRLQEEKGKFPDDIDSILLLIAEAEKQDNYIEKLVDEEQSLIELVDKIVELQKQRKDVDIESIEKKFKAIEEQQEKLRTLKKEKEGIEDLVEEIFDYGKEKSAITSNIKILEEQMPDICPYCGNTL